MPTLDERVAYLEGRLEEHTTTVAALRNDLAGLRTDVQDVRRQIESLDQRLNSRMESLSSRVDWLDSKGSRQFTWLVGIQVATLIAIVSALVSR